MKMQKAYGPRATSPKAMPPSSSSLTSRQSFSKLEPVRQNSNGDSLNYISELDIYTQASSTGRSQSKGKNVRFDINRNASPKYGKEVRNKQVENRQSVGNLQKEYDYDDDDVTSFEQEMPTKPTTQQNFTNLLTKTTNIKTFARFKPLQQNQNPAPLHFLNPNQLLIKNSPNSKPFSFDRIFPAQSTQPSIYQQIGKQLLDGFLSGYNCTLFAYGQTGSGKTFTMYGNRSDNNSGIIPRLITSLFHHLQKLHNKLTLTCSILQIYKQSLTDLLTTKQKPLKIKQSQNGAYVSGLQEIIVNSQEELLTLVDIAEKNREVRGTLMNEDSSRSHVIVMMELRVQQGFGGGGGTMARMNLVDLAGSEKIGKSGSTGQSLEQAKKINLSLSSLSNVINHLSSNSAHIPYRDSKLTRVLQPSLGGNCRTFLIATCSSSILNLQETLSTLKFASRVKTVKTQCYANIMAKDAASWRVIAMMYKMQVEEMREVVGRLAEVVRRLRMEKMGGMNFRVKEIMGELEELEVVWRGALERDRMRELQNSTELLKSFGVSDSSHIPAFANQLQQHLPVKPTTPQPTTTTTTTTTPNTLIPPLFPPTQKHLQSELSEIRINLIQKQRQIQIQNQQKSIIEGKLKSEHQRLHYSEFQNQILKKQIDQLKSQLTKCQGAMQVLLEEKRRILEERFEEFIRGKLRFNNLGGVFLNKNCSEGSYSTLDGRVDKLEHVFGGSVGYKEGLIYGLKANLVEAYIVNQRISMELALSSHRLRFQEQKNNLGSKLIKGVLQIINNLSKALDQSSNSNTLLKQQLQTLKQTTKTKRQCSHQTPKPLISPKSNPTSSLFQSLNNRLNSIISDTLPLTYESAIMKIKERNKVVMEMQRELEGLRREVGKLGGGKGEGVREVEGCVRRVRELEAQVLVQKTKGQQSINISTIIKEFVTQLDSSQNKFRENLKIQSKRFSQLLQNLSPKPPAATSLPQTTILSSPKQHQYTTTTAFLHRQRRL